MKSVSILFLLGLTTLIFGEAPTADAVSVRTTRDISNSRSYRKISTLLSGIEKDVKRDLAAMSSRITSDSRVETTYKHRITSYTRSMKVFKSHMSRAQSAYDHYDAEFKKKVNEDAELLKSLKRQRVFIREERRYINHMEAESLRLKKFSTQYVVIRREIRQMRVQVNKEIRDVERAYLRAKARITSQRNAASSRRSRELSRKNSYSSSVAKYERLTLTYQTLLKKLSVQKNGNMHLKKELQDQLDLLQEIRVILATFKPGTNSDNKYQARYENCVQDFRDFRNKYQNMNCTAL